MLERLFSKNPTDVDLGLNLKPGDQHYRAFVGPPNDYDLVAAMVFNLLTCIGLRQHHRLLDIGCGSLRNGRLLIPYLNRGNYVGVEPNKWLVQEGIRYEIGKDLVRIKRPTFSFRDSLSEFDRPLDIDYAVAQSIFSHCGLDLIEKWLLEAAYHLNDSGVLVATYCPGEEDYQGPGWIYPEVVKYSASSIRTLAEKCGLNFVELNWAHPRQAWVAFGKRNADDFVDGNTPDWNEYIDKLDKARSRE